MIYFIWKSIKINLVDLLWDHTTTESINNDFWKENICCWTFDPPYIILHNITYFVCRGTGHYSYYGPKLLMNKDIVLVTVNYRLGALGFLSLGTEQVDFSIAHCISIPPGQQCPETVNPLLSPLAISFWYL